MFQIQPNPTFDLDVTIPTPQGDGKLKLTFKHKGRKDLQNFLNTLTDNADEEKHAETLAELVTGWDGVDSKFTVEAFGKLLDNYPSATRAILDAYVKTLIDGKEKAKN